MEWVWEQKFTNPWNRLPPKFNIGNPNISQNIGVVICVILWMEMTLVLNSLSILFSSTAFSLCDTSKSWLRCAHLCGFENVITPPRPAKTVHWWVLTNLSLWVGLGETWFPSMHHIRQNAHYQKFYKEREEASTPLLVKINISISLIYQRRTVHFLREFTLFLILLNKQKIVKRVNK